MSFFYHSAPFPVFCTLKMKCFLLYNINWGTWASVSCPLYHGYYQRKNNVRCLFSVYWYRASCILYICKSMVINIFSLSFIVIVIVIVDRDWGFIDDNGNWSGSIRIIMDGVSTHHKRHWNGNSKRVSIKFRNETNKPRIPLFTHIVT